MKPWIELAIGSILTLAVMTGCEHSTPSGMIQTSHLWASFSIHDSDNGVYVEANFNIEKMDGERVQYSDGEHIDCNGSPLTLTSNGYSMQGTVPRNSEGIYTVVFVRSDETISTVIKVPAAPQIVRVIPESGILHGQDTVTVFWDTTQPEPYAGLYLGGSCITPVWQNEAPDNGKATFTSIDKRSPCNPESAISLKVTRKRLGKVNSAFRGGMTLAEIFRSKKLRYVATP